MPSFQGLHKALRWLRLQANRKQREVAEAAGITQAMLCSYEQGKRTPSLQSLEKILDSLDADLTQLSDALALVNNRSPRPAPSPRPEVEPTSSIDLQRLLGAEQPLAADEEEALREVVGSFTRWLSILRSSTLRSAATDPGTTDGDVGALK
jgi:transcriptional regulator with XRE-family HTH domain